MPNTQTQENSMPTQMSIQFNKMQDQSQKIKFFGLVFDSNDMTSDLQKVKAISKIETSGDYKHVQEFQRIATYMGSTIPHLSQYTALQRELIQKGTDFICVEE